MNLLDDTMDDQYHDEKIIRKIGYKTEEYYYNKTVRHVGDMNGIKLTWKKQD